MSLHEQAINERTLKNIQEHAKRMVKLVEAEIVNDLQNSRLHLIHEKATKIYNTAAYMLERGGPVYTEADVQAAWDDGFAAAGQAAITHIDKTTLQTD